MVLGNHDAPKWALLPFLLAVLGLTLAACSFPDPPFDTRADQARLADAKSKRVALISFRHADHVIIDAEPPTAAATKILLAHDKERFLDRYGRVFRLVDATALPAARRASAVDGKDPEAVGRMLRDLNFDAGFVVIQSYGFELVGGDLEDAAREKILEAATSKKAGQAINGPATVQNYDMASEILLIDNGGRVIWRLFGKAQDWPRPADVFNPREFGRSFAGLAPSLQLMVRSMGRVTDLYTDFGAWAVQRSMEGKGPRYRIFLGDRKSAITISPADDHTYAPFICGYDLMAPSRARLKGPPPRGCR
jgi:hypothetical protein